LPLFRQSIRLENWQRQQRRNNPQKDIIAEFKTPEWLNPQFPSGLPPAFQSHPAAPAKETDLAQFMVSHGHPQIFPELFSELLKAFSRAVQSRIVAEAERRRVARIIAISDQIIQLP